MAQYFTFDTTASINKEMRDLMRRIEKLDYRGKTEMRNTDLHMLRAYISRAYPDNIYYRKR